MKYVVVGDVHGCLDELKALLALLALSPESTVLVFVGDLLDKGPHPAETVKYVRELRYPVVLVQGNHEEKHARFRRHEAARKATGKTNPMDDSKGVYASTAAGLSEADVAFLDSARLFYRVPGRNVLVTHAGVAPCVKELPDETVHYASLKGKEKDLLGSLLRVRHVNADTGKGVPVDQTDPAVHPHWTAVYDGRFGRVVYGHESYLDGPVEARHAVGIDLGVVIGGRLCALVLHEDGSEETVTVQAARKYAEPWDVEG